MRFPRLALLAAITFLVGCGSSSGPAVLPNFTIAAAPTAVALQSGGTAQALTVTVAGVNGSTTPVAIALSGLPTGVTASPSALSLAPGQLGQFMLTASTSAAPTSSATVTVTGSADSNSHTATAALSISPYPAPDFTITAAPSSLSLQSGGSAGAFTVTTAAVNGFTGTVNVALSGLPAGVTATPSTLSITPGQLAQFTLAASTAATVTSGATITATGTSSSLSHTATASLAITPAVVPDFTISAPNNMTLPSGGTARTLNVTTGAVNGFSGPITVALSGLPAGVTATPSTLSLTPGQLGQFSLTASTSAPTSTPTITVVGTANALSHTASTTLSIAPAVSNATISTTSFDFGNNLVGNTLTKSVVTVTNTGATAVTLSPTVSGDASYSIDASSSCLATLAAGASCSEAVDYAPTTASGSTPQTATLNMGLGNVPAGTMQTVALTGLSAALAQGTVTATNNPQVALYTMTLPFPGSVTVSFGPDTTYGKQTWTRSTNTAGGTVSIYVAGMLGNSTYHMQASVQLQNGITATDVDHTFTTNAPLLSVPLTVVTTPGMTPQPGLELLTSAVGARGIEITDLQGNPLWTYTLQNAPANDGIEGVKMLPNGHFLVSIGAGSGSPPVGIIEIREIDLGGNIVRSISTTELSAELKTKLGITMTLQEFHHDITPLPNGHWLILSNINKNFTNLPGYPGTTTVLGDVIIDVDQNLQPTWAWSTFDHLNVNRHPMNFPDWTHGNAVVYTPDDHNIVFSMRHQHWVIKINYNDGAGDGHIVWTLGNPTDPTTDPTGQDVINPLALDGGNPSTEAYQYAQHEPAIVGPNSAGIFSLVLMDNGDNRVMADGGACGTGTEAPCYSTVPVFQINENTMTATTTFRQQLDPSLYNFFGGNAEPLDNGDIEYDLCGVGSNSDIFEVTPDNANPTTVWHMHATGVNIYRGFRISSLYPGVQW